ncbi:reverse transcriptase [Tanacetum coccineum]
MLVLSWNYQGVGRSLTVLNLRELCRVHRPDIVFLKETKNKEAKLESIRRSISFDGKFYVNHVGRSGGLALWWRNSYSLVIFYSNKNLIVVEGSSLSPYLSFHACFIYGTHLKEDRTNLWKNNIHQSHSLSNPFLVIGDFNLIGDEFMYIAELFEIPSKGLAYTWDNKRMDGANVRERIDRALGNDSLLEAFPYQSLTHLPLIGSDHSPLLYQTCSRPKKKRKKFKFESMWTLKNSCEDVIQDSWSTSNSNNEIECLRKNLTSCAASLDSWSRCHFGNNKNIIGEITDELAYLQSLPPTNENGSRQRLLLSKLEERWLWEEIDPSGQRNKILMLKNEQGEWIDSPDQLHKLICDHFVDIYSTSGNGNRDFGDVLDRLTPVVNNDMSSKLEAPV